MKRELLSALPILQPIFGRIDMRAVEARVLTRKYGTQRNVTCGCDSRLYTWLDSVCQLDYECRRSAAMEASKIYFLIFGLLTIAGGIVGYVKAGSAPSIIAGSITGILLIVAALLLPEHHLAGLLIGLIVSLLLAAQFIPKFIRTGKVMPAGMMSVLSAIGIAMAVFALLKK
jgi:uncharacterized membrane protein (UPF0136 family)